MINTQSCVIVEVVNEEGVEGADAQEEGIEEGTEGEPFTTGE